MQCRVTCRRPPPQTYPPVVRAAITTRFRPGSLFIADLSQIELRVLAVLSGDPILLDVFKTGQDPHLTTAEAVYATGNVERPKDPYIFRKVGKKVNFLTIYGGGANRLQQVLVEEVGLNVTKKNCYDLLQGYFKKFLGVAKWIEKIVAETDKRGYVEVPFIGTTRPLPQAGSTNREPYAKIAVNFYPQAIGANVQLDATVALDRQFIQRSMLALTGLQVYDNVYVECPEAERTQVRTLIHEAITGSQYWHDVCELYGNEVSLEYDIQEYQVDEAGRPYGSSDREDSGLVDAG